MDTPNDSNSNAAPMDAGQSSFQDSLVSDDNAVSSALAQESSAETTTQPDLTADDTEVSSVLAEQPETEGEEEETTDDWLPTKQEKEFSFDDLAKYAEKRGYTKEQLQSDPGLQKLMSDLLDGDIARRDWAAKKKELAEQPAEPIERPLTPEQVAAAKQRYHAFVGDIVNRVFDPNLVNQMGVDLYKSFGAEPDLQQAPKVGQTLARSLVDGVYTALPHLLLTPDPNTGQPPFMRMVEAMMPGITEMHEHAMYATAWARTARAVGVDLEYGTPEFVEQLTRAGKAIKGFDDIVFKDSRGRILPFQQQVAKKYELLATAVKKAGWKSTGRPGPKKQAQGGDSLAGFIAEENKRGSF